MKNLALPRKTEGPKLIRELCNDLRNSGYKANCVICSTSNKGKCDEENAGYTVKCVQYEAVGVEVTMHGETGRCARVRCGEHYRDYQNGLPRSNLYEHVVEEGLIIENNKGVSMNSQNKWQAPAVIKVGAYRMHRYWRENL